MASGPEPNQPKVYGYAIARPAAAGRLITDNGPSAELLIELGAQLRSFGARIDEYLGIESDQDVACLDCGSPEAAHAARTDMPSDVTPEVAMGLPRVLIDGTGVVWVRDYQDWVNRYWESLAPPGDSPSTWLSYAEIDALYGISTWLMSQKSTPS